MVARKINVVQMLPDLESGGVERGTLELAGYLAASGHGSLVISRGGQMVEELIAGGSRHLEMKYIGEKSPRSLVHLPALRRLFALGKVDIVHLRSRLPAWIGYLALKSLPPEKRPVLVTTFHGYYSVNAYSAIMSRGERVIAISKGIADHLRLVYGVPPSQIRLIYRGVDEKQFNPAAVLPERIKRVRQWMGLGPESGPVILMPGRFTHIKGHLDLLKALAGIKDMSWKAVFLGHMDPGSGYLRQVEEMRQRLALEQRVCLVPAYEDMPAAYAACLVVVSATAARPEAFGRVVVEAQAMGKPVVASAHGGSLETVVHGKSGYLFRPGDYLQLRRRLRQILVNPRRAFDMGRNGRQRVLQRFTTSRMCCRTLDLYQEVLADRARC